MLKFGEQRGADQFFLLITLQRDSIQTIKRNLPFASTKTIFTALETEKRIGATDVLKQELFKRLQNGDFIVITKTGTPGTVESKSRNHVKIIGTDGQHIPGDFSFRDITIPNVGKVTFNKKQETTKE